MIDFEDNEWDELYERAREAAYIRACELVGCNSPEFDALVERLTKYIAER